MVAVAGSVALGGCHLVACGGQRAATATMRATRATANSDVNIDTDIRVRV